MTVAMSLPVSDDPEHVTVAITQPPEADLAHGNRLHGLAPDGSRLPEDQLPADASNGAAPTYMGDNEVRAPVYRQTAGGGGVEYCCGGDCFYLLRHPHAPPHALLTLPL